MCAFKGGNKFLKECDYSVLNLQCFTSMGDDNLSAELIQIEDLQFFFFVISYYSMSLA